MKISVEKLTRLSQAIAESGGASAQEAVEVAENLVGANLAGHDSHGVGMLPYYMGGIRAGQLALGAEATVEHERGPYLLVDGNRGFGQVIGRQAMELGITKAREAGIAVVALKNSYHIGRVGAWGKLCADAGFISIHYVNVQSPNSLVAPYGGSDSRFSTDPYCTALPAAAGRPSIVLDMATSKVAMGKVRVAYNKGVEVPPGTLIDAEASETTDPSVMYTEPKGALLSMGLHKGYGLAVICEALAGAYTGGGTYAAQEIEEYLVINNMLTIILDPDIFVGRDAFDFGVGQFTDWVKQSPPAPGVDEVMVPGEPELKSEAERRANGIPIDDRTWEELLETAELVGLGRDEALRIVGN
jgi:uncharacterized oxidoreductase